ncbi:MAG: acyltransferase [Caulobacterales bacterium]|nr:acyltransferase [Caulobacterales bacterium]
MGILRLLLALCVVVHHTPKAGIIFTNGGVAVQAFYIISGFFISMVLTGKYQSLKTFYVNRALRLYPIYLVTLALAAAQLLISGSNYYLHRSDLAHVTDPLSAAALILSNLTLIGQEWIVWFDLHTPTGALALDLDIRPPAGDLAAWRYLLVPQAWTLSLELAFYAIAPFVVKRRLWVIAALAAASLAVRCSWEIAGVDYNLWVRRFFASEACLFLLGVAAFRLSSTITTFVGPASRYIGFAAIAGLVVLIGVHSSVFGVSAAGRAALFFPLALSLPFIHDALGRSEIDRRVGDLSYPVYIVHILVIAVIRWFWPELVQPAITVVASLAVGIAAYLLIDRPVNRLRQKLVSTSNARLTSAQ